MKKTPQKSLTRGIRDLLSSMYRSLSAAVARSGIRELKKLRWQNFLFLIGAGCINAVGVTMFLAPVNLYDSGISGTSMLLWQVTPEAYTLSLFLILLNVPLFLFGLKKQGWCFTVYSIWALRRSSSPMCCRWTSPWPPPLPVRTCCCAPFSAVWYPGPEAA